MKKLYVGGIPYSTTNEELKAHFEATYEQVYGLRIPNQEAEAITWSVTVASQAVKPKPLTLSSVPGTSVLKPSRRL